MTAKRKVGKKPEAKAYKDDKVVEALEKLFCGKCAYCEAKYGATQKVAVEHFRPKGKVLEAPDHPGYWWLGATWENLLASCTDCNSWRKQEIITIGGASARRVSGKGISFDTVDGKWVMKEGPIHGEKPLLLDPTNDRPEKFIGFALDIDDEGTPIVAYPVAKSGVAHKRAKNTIDVIGLNRSGLVAARKAVLTQMREKGADILEMLEQAGRRDDGRFNARLQELTLRLTKYARPEEPFSAMAGAFLKAFERKLAAKA